MVTSTSLMEQICSSTNLNQALRRVKKNKGCAGVDKLDIDALSLSFDKLQTGKRFARVFWMEATDLNPFLVWESPNRVVASDN
ncbi:RNA-directed DNA polymerase [Vibrio campbellii]|uniref:RNA-directed DNA polymerase n=1 Tax=Vibrio campbellii TaxID=680 RepID=UPI0003FD6C92|nr:RNA-directed DNA polymerase [Vibrio campbellii]